MWRFNLHREITPIAEGANSAGAQGNKEVHANSAPSTSILVVHRAMIKLLGSPEALLPAREIEADLLAAAHKRRTVALCKEEDTSDEASEPGQILAWINSGRCRISAT